MIKYVFLLVMKYGAQCYSFFERITLLDCKAKFLKTGAKTTIGPDNIFEEISNFINKLLEFAARQFPFNF